MGVNSLRRTVTIWTEATRRGFQHRQVTCRGLTWLFSLGVFLPPKAMLYVVCFTWLCTVITTWGEMNWACTVHLSTTHSFRGVQVEACTEVYLSTSDERRLYCTSFDHPLFPRCVRRGMHGGYLSLRRVMDMMNVTFLIYEISDSDCTSLAISWQIWSTRIISIISQPGHKTPI